MTLLTLGGLFLIGLMADILGRFTPLPRITVLLISGLLIGPSGFALISDAFISDWFEPLTNVALTMIGFLMGQKLSIKALKKNGNLAVVIALGKVLGTALVVSLLMWLVTGNIALALILGGIATATDPAATYDVVHESGTSNSFTDNLLSIVAIDDALGLIVFSLLLTLAITGASLVPEALLNSTVHIIASLLVGAVLAVPMSYLTGRLDFGQREGEPIQAEAIGFVLVCAGATVFFELSPILAAMAMGSVVASIATHHNRPFHAIEGIEWPFMILFFILAGASLHLDQWQDVGWLVVMYIFARALGTYLGTSLAAKTAGADTATKRWMGLALMPQAGVALGMALIASQQMPNYSELILTLVLSATILLEVFSPMLTGWVLRKVP